MARIFLVRHVESIANTKAVFQGQSLDSDVSPLGRKQAKALKERFKDEELDLIYTSPLKRTYKTAKSIAEAKKGGVKIVTDNDLLETNHGLWEKKEKAKVEDTWPDLYKMWLKEPSKVKFPKGEKFTDTAKRATTFFNKLIKKDGNFAIVTHGNIIQILVAYMKKVNMDKIWDFTPHSASITLVESHSPAKIVYFNDVKHIKNMMSDIEKHAI